ncbi:hypothetical protein [Photobacterium kasasachensis]|uniref:hypothetical protein n=1 Tax=Photobacterium kasasachensis TaxID=2910240 RepID=UPI003D13F9EF
MIRIFILLIVAVSTQSYAEPEQDLIFLSIGIENYARLGERAKSPSAKEFSKPPSGRHSASRMAYRLAQRAKWGLELRDDAVHFVTRENIWSAVREALSKAKEYDNPLLVLYYNGHGLGEGLGYGHFLIPGDFVGPYPFQDLVEADEHQVVSALGILELIDKAGIPSLVLLDTCYEADDQRFEDTLVPEIESFANDVANILKAMNSKYPAVTASEPTSVAESITDPEPRLSHKSVGPLARRFLIAIQGFGAGNIQIRELVAQLQSTSLDKETKKARVQPRGYEWVGMLPKEKQPIRFIHRLGTGTTANVELLDRVIFEEQEEAEQGLGTHFALSEQPTYAKVALKANSFGNGRPASSGQVNDETDLVFTTALRNSADFVTADSDVSSFSYDFPMNMVNNMTSEFALSEFDRFDDKPGLGLSFRGTTCEVTKGKAKNVVATFEKGVLQTLAMDFSVICASGLVAEGTMDVVW